MIRLLLLCLALFVAGCSTYKLELPQGNIVTEDMVAMLKVGQAKTQVRFILGTPMLVDPFHADRWDYIYQTTENGQVKDRRNFTVWFEGETLKRWEGTALPSPKKPELPAQP